MSFVKEKVVEAIAESPEDQIKKDGVGKMLHRETYLEAGAPVEAVEHEDTENLFYKDARHAIPIDKQEGLINSFGLYICTKYFLTIFGNRWYNFSIGPNREN